MAAYRDLRSKVIEMRRKGMSYSQIRKLVKVSKSALSLWLRDMPLSEERIKELQLNPQKIERYRNTQAKKKQARLDAVFQLAARDVGKLTDREMFLCGLFLYWGEGSKTSYTSIEITNTDPSMIKFGLVWFEILGIDRQDVTVKLKLYKDSDKNAAMSLWSKKLKIKKRQFKIYIKKSNQSDITYKTGYGYGTCSIQYGNRDIYERIMQSLEYIKRYFL